MKLFIAKDKIEKEPQYVIHTVKVADGAVVIVVRHLDGKSVGCGSIASIEPNGTLKLLPEFSAPGFKTTGRYIKVIRQSP